MRVRVLFFASLRERFGQAEWVLSDLPKGSTVEVLKSRLEEAFPGLSQSPYLLARNQSYCEPATPLDEGDEVALIPPVGGG